jgi:cerevisin
MEQILRILVFLCLLFWNKVFAAPVKAHDAEPVEHIVIIDKSAPIKPRVEEVLQRLALTDTHPNVRHVFNNSAFQGFAASMKADCLGKLGGMADISTVEAATTVAGAQYANSRPDAPWGLQRISTSATVNGDDHSLDFTYRYANQRLGSGADIYIVDTGIYTANNIFNGRAKMLWSFDNDLRDNDGHGTHVAGTAAGDILGVASNANIWGVKALDTDGGGWSSDVVAGIDKVISYHDSRKESDSNFLGSVMSMSLASAGNVESINNAILAASDAGIHVVVAAGNDNDDACNASPASVGGLYGPAITVGAVDIDVHKADFSNYGECVDLYAPGVSVISSWTGAPNMINSLSGTSMATPHVTGIVAYAMANRTLASDPALMKEWVRDTALYMDNKLLLANNGIQANEGEGMLGFAKMASTAFEDAKVERPVRTSKSSNIEKK